MDIKRRIADPSRLFMDLVVSLTEDEMESVWGEKEKDKTRERFHAQLDTYLDEVQTDDGYLSWLETAGLLIRGRLFLDIYDEYREELEKEKNRLLAKLIREHLPKYKLQTGSSIVKEVGGNTRLVYGCPGGTRRIVLAGIMTDGERKVLNEVRFHPEDVGLEPVGHMDGILHVFYMQHAAIVTDKPVACTVSDLMRKIKERGGNDHDD